MKTINTILVAAALLLATSQADAYFLNLNNEGLTGGPWGEVTLTDTTYSDLTYTDADAVKFLVDPFESAFFGIGDNFGLQTFFFNENTGRSNLMDDTAFILTNPTGWTMSYSATSEEVGSGPYGKFEFLYAGDGNSRANPLEFYILSTNTDFNIQASQFAVTSPNTEYMFAAHIADFMVDGNEELTSAKFSTATPVPEPGTMLLLGAGFLGLAIYGKRRKNS